MGDGNRRNQPCWCDSGKKYKNCHWSRQAEARPLKSELFKTATDLSNKKYCVHPDSAACSGVIIKAHSVQRALLEKIAESSHLTTWDGSLGSMFKHNGKIVATEVGLKKASTFTGFCSHHDDSVFAPIEKSAVAITKHSALLLMYRAVCREYFAKRFQKELVGYQASLDRGFSTDMQRALQEFVSATGKGVDAGLADIVRVKVRCEQLLANFDASAVHSYWFELSGQPDFAVTGAIFPEVDFGAKELQRLDASTELDLVSFFMIPGESRGLAGFVWLDGEPSSKDFVDSLIVLPDAEVPHAITRYTFEFHENVFMRTSWWGALTPSDQERLSTRLHTSIGPFTPRDNSCLTDDGQRIATWTVKARHDLR